jgi:hypothetical protein
VQLADVITGLVLVLGPVAIGALMTVWVWYRRGRNRNGN